MSHDENEMMIEYSEMTSFNFNSKEYQEVRKDIIEFKETVSGIAWLSNLFLNRVRNFES